MGKWAPNDFYSGGFDYVSGSNAMHVCTQQPANYSEVATYSKGSVSVSGIDFTEKDGSPDGREIEVSEKTIAGSDDGTVNHIVLVNTGDSSLRYITTCADTLMQLGVDRDFGAWRILIRSPI